MELENWRPQLVRRRRRRRSARRRIARALRRTFPVLLVCTAAGLSAGIVRVMEIGQAERDARRGRPAAVNAERESEARQGSTVEGTTAAHHYAEPRAVQLEHVLGTSLVDPEAGGTDEREAQDGAPAASPSDAFDA